MKKGKTVYLSAIQISLIFEAIDMLQIDYNYEHSETRELNEILKKIYIPTGEPIEKENR